MRGICFLPPLSPHYAMTLMDVAGTEFLTFEDVLATTVEFVPKWGEEGFVVTELDSPFLSSSEMKWPRETKMVE